MSGFWPTCETFFTFEMALLTLKCSVYCQHIFGILLFCSPTNHVLIYACDFVGIFYSESGVKESLACTHHGEP